MRRHFGALLAGVAAAVVAVALLSLVGASLRFAPMAALGAAIPVGVSYAVLTAADAEGTEREAR